MRPEWQFIENWLNTDGTLFPKEFVNDISVQLQWMRVQCASTGSRLSVLADEILKTEFSNEARRMAAALVLESVDLKNKEIHS